jgi:hypothetical protein
LSGRFFIRDTNEQLVVELYKLRGRNVELGLEPGNYSVRCENDSGSSISAALLEEGSPFVLGQEHFTAAKQEPLVVRGTERVHPQFGGLDGRWRLGARFSNWYHGGLGSSNSDFYWEENNMTGGLVFSHWLSEKWSLDVTLWSGPMHLVREPSGTADSAFIVSLLFGGR